MGQTRPWRPKGQVRVRENFWSLGQAQNPAEPSKSSQYRNTAHPRLCQMGVWVTRCVGGRGREGWNGDRGEGKEKAEGAGRRGQVDGERKRRKREMGREG